MSETLETPAVTAADSATAQPAAPATRDWTPAELGEWNRTGAIPKLPAKQDSAPAQKDPQDPAVADSAPHSKDKPADSASDSATGKEAKPHLKTKEDTERRFSELLDRVKRAEERADAAERRSRETAPRESKQESQPAPEPYKRLDETKFFQDNPKASYEDYVDAAIQHGAKHVADKAAKEAVQNFQTEQQQKAAQKELEAKLADVKKRYPDFEERTAPAVAKLVDAKQVPPILAALVNNSPVVTDLLYTLADPANLADLLATAKSDPIAAMRKIVLTEQLIQAELAKSKTDDGKGTPRGDDGKFVKSDKKEDGASEPKPRAPKPPADVGGRGSAGEDAAVAAARSGNFSAFSAEMDRKARAAHS